MMPARWVLGASSSFARVVALNIQPGLIDPVITYTEGLETRGNSTGKQFYLQFQSAVYHMELIPVF